VWEQEVARSSHLIAAGEKLALCHWDYLNVYSCDRGQLLFQVSYLGVTYYSPLCGEEGRGVLGGVGKLRIQFPGAVDSPLSI